MNENSIVVTGGCGYIGSHTIIELIEKKYNPYSLDNYSNSEPSNYKRINRITGQEVKFTELNLCDLHKTKQELLRVRPKAIIHFAAFKSVPQSVKNPLDYYQNNLLSLFNILKICEELHIDKFIFSSSCSVYGNTTALPVSEGTPLEKVESPYAQTKKMSELILQDFCKANPWFKCVSLRYFNPAGAHHTGLLGELPLGVPNNLVPFLTQTAQGIRKSLTVFGNDYPTIDGTCIRDYVHVSDIAAAHVNAIEYCDKMTKENYEVFNLGSGKGSSVLEVIQTFEKTNKLKVNYTIGNRRSGDVAAIYADNTKAKSILNWKPRYQLEDMMRSAWKWEQEMAKPIK